MLSPSFLRRQRKIDLQQIQIKSGKACFFDGRIRLLFHSSIIGGLALEIKGRLLLAALLFYALESYEGLGTDRQDKRHRPSIRMPCRGRSNESLSGVIRCLGCHSASICRSLSIFPSEKTAQMPRSRVTNDEPWLTAAKPPTMTNSRPESARRYSRLR